VQERLFDPVPSVERRGQLESARDLGRPRDGPAPAAATLVRVEGAWCGPCPHRRDCSSMASEHACAEPVDSASVRFHPREAYGEAALEVIGGRSLEQIVALPVRLPCVGDYVAQVRFRKPCCALPKRKAYGIRLDQILRRKVRTAAEVRAFAGIPDGAALVLLCFAEDPVLENLWDDASRFHSVAAGGWDLISAPSYSLWYRRPRPFHFHSLKRSYLAFEAFQQEGTTAIPRVDFIDTRDVERQAEWLMSNQCVEMVSLDWMTSRGQLHWDTNVDFLALFDRLTRNRLRYLINGTTTFPRIRYLFELLGDRLTLSDATAVGPIANLGAISTEDLSADMLSDPTWRRRLATRESAIAKARAAASARLSHMPSLASQTVAAA
jgi:hypothetical protein